MGPLTPRNRFYFFVMGKEVVVGEGPVGGAVGSGLLAGFGGYAQVARVGAGDEGSPVEGAAADAGAGVVGAEGFGGVAGGEALVEPVDLGGGELVGGEVVGGGFPPGAGFKGDDAEAGGGEFGEDGSSARAGADDDGVDGVVVRVGVHGGTEAGEFVHRVGSSSSGVAAWSSRRIWVKPVGSSAKPVKPMRSRVRGSET